VAGFSYFCKMKTAFISSSKMKCPIFGFLKLIIGWVSWAKQLRMKLYVNSFSSLYLLRLDVFGKSRGAVFFRVLARKSARNPGFLFIIIGWGESGKIILQDSIAVFFGQRWHSPPPPDKKIRPYDYARCSLAERIY